MYMYNNEKFIFKKSNTIKFLGKRWDLSGLKILAATLKTHSIGTDVAGTERIFSQHTQTQHDLLSILSHMTASWKLMYYIQYTTQLHVTYCSHVHMYMYVLYTMQL